MGVLSSHFTEPEAKAQGNVRSHTARVAGGSRTQTQASDWFQDIIMKRRALGYTLDVKEKKNPESSTTLDWVAGKMAMSVVLLNISVAS